jgi:hypothetical protein
MHGFPDAKGVERARAFSLTAKRSILSAVEGEAERAKKNGNLGQRPVCPPRPHLQRGMAAGDNRSR